MNPSGFDSNNLVEFGEGSLAPFFKFSIGARSQRFPFLFDTSQAFMESNNRPFQDHILHNMFSNQLYNGKSQNFLMDHSFQNFNQKQSLEAFSFQNIQKTHFSLEGQIEVKKEESEVSFRPQLEPKQNQWRGLRLLSHKVKKIIQEERDTSYKQVADKLVAEMKQTTIFENQSKLQREEQNVKRRVYDALNVLIAADVIVKKGKTLEATERTSLYGKCLSKHKWEKYSELEGLVV